MILNRTPLYFGIDRAAWLETGSLTSDPLFPGRLDTLIKCPLKNKWALDDTLYLEAKSGICVGSRC